MIIIPQSVEILEQNDLNEHIEECARTCYQSFEKKCEGSADRMVNALLKNGHTAMLEHGSVFFKIPQSVNDPVIDDALNIITDGFSSRNALSSKVEQFVTATYVTCNYRKYMELGQFKREALEHYRTKQTEYHPKRITMRCVTNLQVATELLRHRRLSFAMESTRYCNYSKGQFGNELTFITPCFLADNESKLDMDVWAKCMESIEADYLLLLASGWSAQEAAQVLPKALKTQIVMTGWEEDWMQFFNLRYFEQTGKVHPQMKELSTMMYELFNNYVKVNSKK